MVAKEAIWELNDPLPFIMQNILLPYLILRRYPYPVDSGICKTIFSFLHTLRHIFSQVSVLSAIKLNQRKR